MLDVLQACAYAFSEEIILQKERSRKMLGENIKKIRQKKGYTQEEVANRLHVTRQTISKWEKNYSVPDADLLVRLAEILEVPTSELLSGEVELEEKEIQKDEYAEQLAHIAEQMAIKNRRASKIWKVIGITLLSIILLYLFITIIGMRAYSYDTDSVYESQEIVVETEQN